MQGKRKKILLLSLSIIFLAVYLNSDWLFKSFEHGIVHVEVMSENQILCIADGNGVAGLKNDIRYDGYPVAYDSISNTIYIPQNIEDSNWIGKLTSDTGELYFAEDEYWKDKKAAIAEGHLFKLYQVTEENHAIYNVVFTGMPILCLSEEGIYWEEDKEIRQGSMQIFDPYSEGAFYQSSECTFNTRGGSSLFYPKSSYKLELQNNKLSLLGMRKDDDWTPIKTWVNFFLKEQFSNYEEGAELLNMENAIDYNLFCLLIGGSDNMRKNIFFIAEYQEGGNYSFKKVPWDLNATWGNPWVDIEECNFTLYDPTYIENVDTWCTDISTLYFYDEKEVSKLLLERWQELRKKIITKENINTIINKQFEYLDATGAYKRNYEKWPNGIEYWQAEYLYEYVDKRIDFLDEYFAQLYEESLKEKIYGGVDYSEEFEARYYWEKNNETLSELYSYDAQVLLEHYALYGKPFGLKARR